MDRPSLRQLECAAALAEHLNFTRAAESLYITQPAFSAQIAQLESALGLRLFERDRRRVVPTPAGEELVRRARAALVAIDAFVDAARALQRPLAGPLRLGVIPTVAPYVLPRLVRAAHAAHPDLRLLLREEETARLVELTRAGELELLLLALEAELADLERLPLWRDPFLLAAPEDHALAARAEVREEELASAELLLLEDGHCLKDQVLAVCRRAGASELGDFRASSLATLIGMVAGGVGVTLLPAMTRAERQPGIVLRPLAGRPARTIGLAWRKSSARRAEFELLAELLRRHPPPGVEPVGRPA